MRYLYSGNTVSSERRGSLQLLPSRPAVSVGMPNADRTSFNSFGHIRCYKPSLTVEEVRRV